MQVAVQAVSDVKTDSRGTSSKIDTGSNGFFYVNEDATPLMGKLLEITYQEKTSAKGNKYKIAKIEKVIEAAAGQAATNGHAGQVRWIDYATMAKLAHEMAVELEPDIKEVLRQDANEEIEPAVSLDRSAARAALVNTVMIAFVNGKITLAEIDEDRIPF